MTAYATNVFTIAGGEDEYDISFEGVSPGYIEEDHVKYYVEGVVQDNADRTFLTPTRIKIDPKPADGTVISFRRETSPTTALVDWLSGAPVTEVLLDKVNTQYLYLAQEAADKGTLDSSDAAAISAASALASAEYVESQVPDWELSNDTTPQLGGTLDTNSNDIDNVTPTELSRLEGITDNIQDLIDANESDIDAIEAQLLAQLPTIEAGDQHKVLKVNSDEDGYDLLHLAVRNMISGLTLSVDTDTDHDIAVAVGQCIDSANEQALILGTVITKQTDAVFAEGDDAGGMFTGTVAADTWYAVHLIEKDSDGTIDVGFDTSSTAANIPAGYTRYRRIGWVLTDSSANIINFTDYELVGGSIFRAWRTTLQDYSGAAPTTRTLYPVSVPPGELGEYLIYYSDGAENYAWVRHANAGTVVASITEFTLAVNSSSTRSMALHKIVTDSSSQIAARASNAGTLFVINTINYTDRRNND